MTAREEVRHLEAQPEDHPEMTGWYIVYVDAEGFDYDAVGPYDSQAEAERIMAETSID